MIFLNLARRKVNERAGNHIYFESGDHSRDSCIYMNSLRPAAIMKETSLISERDLNHVGIFKSKGV